MDKLKFFLQKSKKFSKIKVRIYTIRDHTNSIMLILYLEQFFHEVTIIYNKEMMVSLHS